MLPSVMSVTTQRSTALRHEQFASRKRDCGCTLSLGRPILDEDVGLPDRRPQSFVPPPPSDSSGIFLT